MSVSLRLRGLDSTSMSRSRAAVSAVCLTAAMVLPPGSVHDEAASRSDTGLSLLPGPRSGAMPIRPNTVTLRCLVVDSIPVRERRRRVAICNQASPRSRLYRISNAPIHKVNIHVMIKYAGFTAMSVFDRAREFECICRMISSRTQGSWYVRTATVAVGAVALRANRPGHAYTDHARVGCSVRWDHHMGALIAATRPERSQFDVLFIWRVKGPGASHHGNRLCGELYGCISAAVAINGWIPKSVGVHPAKRLRARWGDVDPRGRAVRHGRRVLTACIRRWRN